MKVKIKVRLFDLAANKEKFTVYIEGDPLKAIKTARERIIKLFEEPKPL
jgi:hypothetical protein